MSAEAAQVATSKKSRVRYELQDRDKQLMGFLALCRHLSTAQVSRLCFPRRDRTTTLKRLLGLAGIGARAFDRPFLSRSFYKTFEGSIVAVWGLTELGYVTATTVLGASKKPPTFALSKEFLEHTILLNDIFVGVVAGGAATGFAVAAPARVPRRRLRNAREGAYSVARALPFRWISSEAARLPWAEYDAAKGGVRDRFIQPDAILEIPSTVDGQQSTGRRLFLECETGSHTIIPVGTDKSEAKPGSTWAKVERYDSFLNEFVDSSRKATAYSQAYKDGFAPEVWFVVPAERRAQAINAAIARWRKENAREAVQARALTFSRAVEEVRGVLGLGSAGPQSLPGEPENGGGAPRMSPGGLKLQELTWLTEFYSASVSRIKELRRHARERHELPPEYPPHLDEVRGLLSRLLTSGG